MNKLNEEIKRNKELMGLQEQTAARQIGYRTCSGAMSSSVHNIMVNGNSPELGNVITITTTAGQTRTVFVTSVSTSNNTNHPLQDVPCETSCPKCEGNFTSNVPYSCWNLTTGQACSACDQDPDCWQDGSNTSTPIPCASCGCGGVLNQPLVFGCMNGPGPGTQPGSSNYDPNATCDDGSCIPVPDDFFLY